MTVKLQNNDGKLTNKDILKSKFSPNIQQKKRG